MKFILLKSVYIHASGIKSWKEFSLVFLNHNLWWSSFSAYTYRCPNKLPTPFTVL